MKLLHNITSVKLSYNRKIYETNINVTNGTTIIPETVASHNDTSSSRNHYQYNSHSW